MRPSLSAESFLFAGLATLIVWQVSQLVPLPFASRRGYGPRSLGVILIAVVVTFSFATSLPR